MTVYPSRVCFVTSSTVTTAPSIKMSISHREDRRQSVQEIEGRSRSIALSQPGVAHVGDEKYRKASTALNAQDSSWLEESSRATKDEQDRSLLENLKLYPAAVGWSLLLSTAVIMEGFDILLITNLLAVDKFKQDFGHQLADGSYEISSPWQSGLTNGALVGEILGLMVNGWIADKIGYRYTMIGALTAVTGFIFIVFFVQSLPQLLAGLILMGVPWGVFQTLTTTYASEVCPTGLRAYLTTYVNLCWVLGQLLASGVLKGTQSMDTHWAYRIPYALQWIWPVPLIIGIFLAPESPWWLVRKERYDQAKHSLTRLTSRNSPSFNLNDQITMMRSTNELEKANNAGTSYLDCFKGVDLRRTEIACMTWLVQTLCGSTFMGYSTYFYENAGLDDSNAFTLTVVQYAIGAVGTLLAWAMMTHFGRRTLYVGGQAALFTLLMIIGFIGLAPDSNSSAQWAIGSLLIIFTFVYDSTVGPVCYSLVAEVSSTRLRQKTVVLARMFYNIGGLITNILTPRQLNPGDWNWGPLSSFFWAGTCFLCLVWSYFRLPEPKGRTYAEMDVLFENKVSARKFKSTNVDAFMSNEYRQESVMISEEETHEKGDDKS